MALRRNPWPDELPRLIEDIRRRWDRDRLSSSSAPLVLENPHRLLSVMKPSATYQQQRPVPEFAACAAGLSPEDLWIFSTLRLRHSDRTIHRGEDLHRPGLGITGCGHHSVESESRRGITVLSRCYERYRLPATRLRCRPCPMSAAISRFYVGPAGAKRYPKTLETDRPENGRPGRHLASGCIGGRETWRR